jgi:hypothetical protein
MEQAMSKSPSVREIIETLERGMFGKLYAGPEGPAPRTPAEFCDLANRLKVPELDHFRDLALTVCAHDAVPVWPADAQKQLPTKRDETEYLLAVRKVATAFNYLKTPAKQRKRRRQSIPRVTPLTPEQTEAVHLVSEHKGNFSAAARAAGKSRTMISKLYRKAMKKLGKSASALKPKTRPLPLDHRGQVNIADPDALDLNAPEND